MFSKGVGVVMMLEGESRPPNKSNSSPPLVEDTPLLAFIGSKPPIVVDFDVSSNRSKMFWEFYNINN